MLVNFSRTNKTEARQQPQVTLNSLMNILRPDICSCHCCQITQPVNILANSIIAQSGTTFTSSSLNTFRLYYNTQYHYVSYCLDSSYPKVPVPLLVINIIILLTTSAAFLLNLQQSLYINMQGKFWCYKMEKIRY